MGNTTTKPQEIRIDSSKHVSAGLILFPTTRCNQAHAESAMLRYHLDLGDASWGF
jgi:hypothetical protein